MYLRPQLLLHRRLGWGLTRPIAMLELVAHLVGVKVRVRVRSRSRVRVRGRGRVRVRVRPRLRLRVGVFGLGLGFVLAGVCRCAPPAARGSAARSCSRGSGAAPGWG